MTTTADRTADLEPSLIFDQTYVTRRRRGYIDAALVLSMTVGLLTLIPARFILPGMTDLGRPGLVAAFVLFCWWILVQFSSPLRMPGPQPLRWAVFVFAVTVLISYAIGLFRGLSPMEQGAADRAVLFFCAFFGVLLTAADGVPNWFRLRRVLRVLVACAAVVAAIGIVQYLTGFDVTAYLVIPGLQGKGWTPVFEARGSSFRVASTTSHYIELAAFLALTLPFAIHFACFSRRRGRRQMALVAAFLIIGGIAATISRTGMLALVLMLLVLVPVWTWRMRFNIGMLTIGLCTAAAAASPGLIDTLTHLFDSPSSNPAFTVRAARYPMAFRYIAERPWFGRGTGTWVAPQYQVMDNQWLDTLLTNGIVGVVALAGLHITGIVLAYLALRRSRTIEDRHLCAALISTQLIGLAVAGTFDSLSFMTYATILALTLGLCGTAWRLTHPARTVRTSTTRWFLLDGPAGAQRVPAGGDPPRR